MSSLRQKANLELRQVPVLVGRSEEARRMRDFAKLAANTTHNVLLLGETGTGKDHLAELIHHFGPPGRPFVPVDCGALTESLSENELFGHTSGAFTDARSIKRGLVQVAEGGTLFFNEVANMSLPLQAKFLRILEKKSFRQVGGTSEFSVNTRIIAATNADLESAVRRGQMRHDLYQRLNVVTFTVAPLRKRSGDIPDITEYFLRQEQSTKVFSPEAMIVMKNYHWPGNVRELRGTVVRAVFHSSGQEKIGLEQVSSYITNMNVDDTVPNERNMSFALVGKNGKLPTLHEVERDYLLEVMEKADGNMLRASKIAGIARTTLYKKVGVYGLQKLPDPAINQ